MQGEIAAVENKVVSVARQVGFGSEYGIDKHWKLLVLLQFVQRIWTKMPSLYNIFVTCNKFLKGPNLDSAHGRNEAALFRGKPTGKLSHRKAWLQ
jgi:hypothetical protein